MNKLFSIFLYSLYLILPVLCSLMMCFGFWLGGFDFDERGPTAVWLLIAIIWSIGFGGLASYLINLTARF